MKLNYLTFFQVSVSLTFEETKRDEFGWVEGYAPGNGRYYEPKIQVVGIVCQREEQAREWALHYYRLSLAKDVEVVGVKSLKINGMLLDYF
jgi:hypothetical protein